MAVKQSVTFRSGGLQLSGDLFLPDSGSHTASLPALVLSGPFTGVKEQVTGNYARRLADHGYVSLAFDHRNFGESEGEPRQHEDPAGKLEDLADAVSFLRTLSEVDADRIGACGICLGTSYILKFSAFDPRIKAVALIAGAYNDPLVMRENMGGEQYRQQLSAFREIRQRQYETQDVEYMPAISTDGPAAMPGQEPFDYYGTDRAKSASWQNQVTSLSIEGLITLDAASATDFISPTPLLVVHGEVDAFLSPESAKATYERAGEPKKLVWIPTTNHIDLYDQETYVQPAVEHAVDWFQTYLSG